MWEKSLNGNCAVAPADAKVIPVSTEASKENWHTLQRIVDQYTGHGVVLEGVSEMVDLFESNAPLPPHFHILKASAQEMGFQIGKVYCVKCILHQNAAFIVSVRQEFEDVVTTK